MPILADTIDGVIGVDTHRDTLAAAVLGPVGGVLAQTATSADATGYQQLLESAGTQHPQRPGAALLGDPGRRQPRAPG
jgi:transposase